MTKTYDRDPAVGWNFRQLSKPQTKLPAQSESLSQSPPYKSQGVLELQQAPSSKIFFFIYMHEFCIFICLPQWLHDNRDSSSLIHLEHQNIHFYSYCFHILNLQGLFNNTNQNNLSACIPPSHWSSELQWPANTGQDVSQQELWSSALKQ